MLTKPYATVLHVYLMTPKEIDVSVGIVRFFFFYLAVTHHSGWNEEREDNVTFQLNKPSFFSTFKTRHSSCIWISLFR